MMGGVSGYTAVLVLTLSLPAQSEQASPAASTADLLAEVEALRADLQAVASASLRAQLLVARLSLQEQRIATLGKQLTDVQGQLGGAVGARTAMELQIKRFTEAVEGGAMPLEERKAIDQQLEGFKALLGQRRSAEQQLRSQESELAAVIAGEQNRWIDFNARLDEIERALPGSSPR